ncbi:tRNA (5-methylaminomethyl-2-thiouridine)(34)-methyltransferase MnmD [Iodidimonas muriae]|uniref:tRNA (5-methylaminomethyl-2-thiouridine)(34)-methyltransferase MnmD n=1 Tax=Iodidimonas muriae TaxID=261467 RepID=UPI001666FBFC|nr:tRNA (5-methylaminomethyl-2-thiouridine)(34)-methyltransferase MnmD [Iodidimonas muriae]
MTETIRPTGKRVSSMPLPIDNPEHALALPHPRLDWEKDAPRSLDHGDKYYDLHDGLLESIEVFIKPCEFNTLWHSRSVLTVGETGFGTGLNFLSLWHHWREHRASARLHFLSVENRPLQKADLLRALKPFQCLAPLAQELVAQWPPAYSGIHRLIFDKGHVHLTLCFGDAATMFDQVEGQMDAWFLDGFAPSRNLDMWSAPLYAQIARLSAPDARLATFTAAGHVRRGLMDAGFHIEKQPGFQGKRERLVGRYKGRPASPDLEAPWFAPPAPSPGPVAVIGDGIAARMMIAALRDHGLDNIQIASPHESPLPAAILAPRIDLGHNAAARFSIQSLLSAWRTYDALGAWHGPRGVLSLLEGKRAESWGKKAVESLNWPADLLRLCTHDEASKIAGVSLKSPAMHWPHAGCIIPQTLYDLLPPPQQHIPHSAHSIQQIGHDAGWRILGTDGKILCETPTLILAAGTGTAALLGANAPEMVLRPGQLGLHPPKSSPKIALNAKSHITPTLDLPTGPARIAGIDLPFMDLPAPRSLWSGTRVTSPDHGPFAGPVFDRDWFESAYAAARLDKRRRDFPEMRYHAGLYIFSGLGARGFQTAPLMAQSIAAQIANTLSPLETAQRHALHPARFMIRKIIRGIP